MKNKELVKKLQSSLEDLEIVKSVLKQILVSGVIMKEGKIIDFILGGVENEECQKDKEYQKDFKEAVIEVYGLKATHINFKPKKWMYEYIETKAENILYRLNNK